MPSTRWLSFKHWAHCQPSPPSCAQVRHTPMPRHIARIVLCCCIALLGSHTLPGNPVASAQDYRLEPLIAIRTLSRLDKNVYEDDEKSEAKEVGVHSVSLCCDQVSADLRAKGGPAPPGRAESAPRPCMSLLRHTAPLLMSCHRASRSLSRPQRRSVCMLLMCCVGCLEPHTYERTLHIAHCTGTAQNTGRRFCCTACGP